MEKLTVKQKIAAWERMKRLVKSNKFGKKSMQDHGLCHVINSLYWARKEPLSVEVYKYLEDTIRKLKRMPNSAFVWEPGVKPPRIKYIDKQIRKLKLVGARKKKTVKKLVRR